MSNAYLSEITLMGGAVLGREALLAALAAAPPLVEGLRDPATQLQPNGIDLTLREVARFRPASPGRLAADPPAGAPAERVLAATEPLVFDTAGGLDLAPGPYQITFNEVVHLPRDLMAFGKPRSSLLRSAVSIQTAVWDAGYSGRSVSLLLVHHPGGFRVERDARLLQLVFVRLAGPVAEGYAGAYQGENV